MRAIGQLLPGHPVTGLDMGGRTGRCSKLLRAVLPEGSRLAAAVSADGRTAVSGGHDGTVRVWDLAGTAALRVLSGHTGRVWGVAVTGDGRTAVSGSGDRKVRMWDLVSDWEQVRWIADGDVLAIIQCRRHGCRDTAGQVYALRLNVPAAVPA